MSKKPTTGVVFDLGGVILDFDHMTICRRAAELASGGGSPGAATSAAEVYHRIFASGLEEKYDKGLVTTEDFYRQVIELLGIPAPMLSIDAFSAIWNGIFSPNDEVVAIIESLKGRVPLYLLSNTNELHFEFAVREYPFIADLFDKSFLSYRMGARKPEPVIFDQVIKGTGAPAGALFYIDDSAVHIEAARRAGIDAWVYTTPELLRAELSKRGFQQPSPGSPRPS